MMSSLNSPKFARRRDGVEYDGAWKGYGPRWASEGSGEREWLLQKLLRQVQPLANGTWHPRGTHQLLFRPLSLLQRRTKGQLRNGYADGQTDPLFHVGCHGAA